MISMINDNDSNVSIESFTMKRVWNMLFYHERFIVGLEWAIANESTFKVAIIANQLKVGIFSMAYYQENRCECENDNNGVCVRGVWISVANDIINHNC